MPSPSHWETGGIGGGGWRRQRLGHGGPPPACGAGETSADDLVTIRPEHDHQRAGTAWRTLAAVRAPTDLIHRHRIIQGRRTGSRRRIARQRGSHLPLHPKQAG